MSKKPTGDRVLGDKLRNLRTQQGRTMRDVEAQTGVSNPLLSQIENGFVMPSVQKVAVLAAYYEADLNELCEHMVARS